MSPTTTTSRPLLLPPIIEQNGKDHHPIAAPSPHVSVHRRLGPRTPPPPLSGNIFICNRHTMNQCLHHRVFGLPSSRKSIVDQIVPGMKLFLFEFEERQLWGIFEATSFGDFNIVPDAFPGGSFPCQVRVQPLGDCVSLKEQEFREAITENYYEKKKFHLQLSRDQVSHLCSLFLRKYSNAINVVARDIHAENVLREDEPYIATRYNLGLDPPALLTDDGTHSFPKDLVGVPSLPRPRHLDFPERKVVMSDGIYANIATFDDCLGKAGFSAESVIPFQAGVLNYAYSDPQHLVDNHEFFGENKVSRLMEQHEVEVRLISDSMSLVSNSRSVWSRISACPNPMVERYTNKKEGQFSSSVSLSDLKVATTFNGTQSGLMKVKPSVHSSMQMNRKETPANNSRVEAVTASSISATTRSHSSFQKKNIIDHAVCLGDDLVKVETLEENHPTSEFLVQFKRRRMSSNNAALTSDQPSAKHRRKLTRPSFDSSEEPTTRSLDLHEDPMQRIGMEAENPSLCYLDSNVLEKKKGMQTQNSSSCCSESNLNVKNEGQKDLGKCKDSFQSECLAMGNLLIERMYMEDNKMKPIISASQNLQGKTVSAEGHSSATDASQAEISLKEDFLKDTQVTKNCGSKGQVTTNAGFIDQLETKRTAPCEMDADILHFNTEHISDNRTASSQLCRQLGHDKQISHSEMHSKSQTLLNAKAVGTEYVCTQLVLGLPTHNNRECSLLKGSHASGNNQADGKTVCTLLALGQAVESKTKMLQEKPQDSAVVGTGQVNGVYSDVRTETRCSASYTRMPEFNLVNTDAQSYVKNYSIADSLIQEVGTPPKDVESKGGLQHDMPISLVTESSMQSSNSKFRLCESAPLDILKNQPQLNTASDRLCNQIDLKSILQNGSQISSIKLQLGPEPCLILKLGDSLISSINNNSNLLDDTPRKQPTIQLQ